MSDGTMGQFPKVLKSLTPGILNEEFRQLNFVRWDRGFSKGTPNSCHGSTVQAHSFITN